MVDMNLEETRLCLCSNFLRPLVHQRDRGNDESSFCLNEFFERWGLIAGFLVVPKDSVINWFCWTCHKERNGLDRIAETLARREIDALKILLQ